jgi:glycosidase
MEDMMAWWIEDVGIDGFRCDVAEMVPLDFWEHVRARLDTIKPVMMLAEGSKPELHAKAFDLTYSWNLYDQLDSLLSGNRPATVIDSLLLYESLQYPTGALRMRFTTNHDKNAWDAPAVEKFGISGLRAATVLTNTIPGVPMLYTGEEAMNNVKLSLFEKVPVDWSRPRELGTLNTALFMLRSMHPAMQQGEMVRIPTDHDRDVYAFVRVLGSDRVLVVINLHPEPVSATLTVPAELRESMRGMRGLFGKVNITSNADGRATVSLGGHEFDIAPR